MTDNRFAAYQTAKTERPLWATALIVAGVIALAGVAFAILGMNTAGWFFVAAAIAALVGGISALAGVIRRAP